MLKTCMPVAKFNLNNMHILTSGNLINTHKNNLNDKAKVATSHIKVAFYYNCMKCKWGPHKSDKYITNRSIAYTLAYIDTRENLFCQLEKLIMFPEDAVLAIKAYQCQHWIPSH